MRPRRRRAGALSRLTLVVLSGLVCLGDVRASELTIEQQRGRQLFFKGAIAGEATPRAQIGAEATAAPATMVPCANCHGEDGRGGAEGAIEAPDISWRGLSNPVGHIQRSGRRHGPFTPQSFALAVSRGLDPSGASLDAIMPRYNFTQDQLDALIAYLKAIEADQAPGVTSDSVRIGVLLPTRLASTPAGESLVAILRAVFGSLNSAGGIYGRRIDVEIAPSENLSEGRSGAHAQEFFALLDPSLSPRARRVSLERKTPVISATPPFSRDEMEDEGSSFYLFGGVQENIDVLLAYLASRAETKRSSLAFVYQNEAAPGDAPQVVARLASVHGWPAPLSIAYDAREFDAAKLSERLERLGVEAVAFLGDGASLYSLVHAADARAWRPYFLLPAPAIDGAVFSLSATIAQRLLLAYPVFPVGQSDDTSFNALRRAAGLGGRHAAAVYAAYCIAQVLIAGLKDAGRELGASRFIDAVEHLQKLETGVTRPLSFGPGRRIGAPGAYVVGVDVAARRFIRLSEWLEGRPTE